MVEETISDGLKDISKAIEKMDPKDEASVQAAVDEMNNFTDQWNNIVSQAGPEIGGMMNSTNLLSVVAKAIKPSIQEEITDQKVEDLTKDGNLEKIIAGATSGQVEIEGKSYTLHKIDKIDISPTSKQQFAQILVDNYDTSKLSAESKTKFTDAVAKLSGLLFE